MPSLFWLLLKVNLSTLICTGDLEVQENIFNILFSLRTDPNEDLIIFTTICSGTSRPNRAGSVCQVFFQPSLYYIRRASLI